MLRGSEGSLEVSGKHSKVYLIGKYAIKVFSSRFRYNFLKEAKFLLLLQPFGFVPRLYSIDPENLKIVMQRVEGCRIADCLNADVVAKCFDLCYLLDRMGIQKEEMNHPDKHVIVSDRVYFIDFERGRFKKNPSNLTQFCAYLEKRGVEMDRQLVSSYKKGYDHATFLTLKKEVLKSFSRTFY